MFVDGVHMLHRCLLALIGLSLTGAIAFAQPPLGPDDPPPHWIERLRDVLATIAFLLLLFGVAGVIFEITHPGGWVPGVVGILCLVLALFAMRHLPINYVALALLVLGIVFIILEVKVHSAGVMTTAGILCLLGGSAFFVDSSEGVPGVAWLAVAPVTIAIGIIMMLLVRNVVRAHRSEVKTGMDTLIGATARVEGDMYGEGFVSVSGELWRARCGQRLQDGENVHIVAYDGLTLYVKPITH